MYHMAQFITNSQTAMSEIEYRNRSISQLVNELNSLGQAKVGLEPLQLLAVHQHDNPSFKRFKNSQGQQFFTPQHSDKKYPYTDVVPSIGAQQLSPLADLFARGFNVSLMMVLPKDPAQLTQLLGQLSHWMGNAVYAPLQFGDQQITDLITEGKLSERDIDRQLNYYPVKQNHSLAFLDKMLRGHNAGLSQSQSKPSITIIKVRPLINNQASNNELSIIALPEAMFTPSAKSSDYLSVARSQLTQIFNYLKLNPAKKYQHFSKLLTKRLPVTNTIAGLVLEQSLCMVVNWVGEGSGEQKGERFAFYERMRGLSALLRIEEQRQCTVCELPLQFSSGGKQGQGQQGQKRGRESKLSKTDRTPIAHLSDENELDYCRSFQRKTHKYSINQPEEDEALFSNQQHPSSNQQPSEFMLTRNQSPSPVTHAFQRGKEKTPDNLQFDETMPKQRPLQQHLNESEEITILKANHAIEVSQYHQTIQQLNRKILAFSQENQLEQLYTIHERELMLLELKIKELRKDISILSQGADDKSYKAMVRKLNEEVKRLEAGKGEQKVSSGKTAILEKQLQESRKKCEESEAARKKLAYQMEYLTKRLVICDAEIEHLNKKEEAIGGSANGIGSTGTLSASDVECLRQVEVLLGEVLTGSQQASRFLIRKMTNVLEDLSATRNSVLECNDFLVQLEEHLEAKLGSKEPQTVLDCNKFIRNFLMQTLNVF